MSNASASSIRYVVFHTPGPAWRPGVDVSEISLGMDNSRQAWIADPDGNSIELMEYGYSSLQISG